MAKSFSPLPPSIMAIILATLHSTLVNAQQKPSFVWGFSGEEATTTRLTECKQTSIFVNGTYYPDVPGAPPYYLVAFPPYGIPTKTNLGSDLKNLIWTVPYSPGTRLIIGMVDGNDNAGGIATQIFPVGASQGTRCHDANPSTPVKLEVISKGALNTCGFLSVHITGGQKPYTFIVAETDTVRATANITMGPNDDQFDYLNILRPGSQFVAAAVDANGVFSTATDLITTQGGGDTSCPGQTSQSRMYSPPASFPLPAIAGIVAGVIIISGLVFWFIRRRSQQMNKGSTDLLQVTPLSPRHQDGYADSHNHAITPYMVHDPEQQQPHFDPYTDQQHPPHTGTYLSPNSGQVPLPGQPVTHSVSGSSNAPWSPTTTHGGRESSAMFSESGAGSSSAGAIAPYGTDTSTQQLVLQHQDASDVVELPPAYQDRPPQAIPGAPTRTEQRRRKN